MWTKLIAFFVITTLLAACSAPPRVAVDERVTVSRRIEIDQIGGALIRHVQPGDTLHAIAFVADLNVNDVAAWNGISDTGRLQVGQRIRLTRPVDFIASRPAVSETMTESNRAQQTQASIPPPPKVVVQPQISQSQVPIDELWNWPLRGKVLRSFSQANGQQGIDIGAQVGDAVNATNTGEVVYVGNGLKGYGNLVIVKHNETYLSAYAHNSEIYVREGERISARQRIASVGTNRYREAALHFQIRKNGQPVNPLLFLSKDG